MSYHELYIKQLRSLNPDLLPNLQGCTALEVSNLESYINHKLPAVFKDFMLWMGKGPEKIMPETTFFFHNWLPNKKENDLLKQAKELVIENEIIPNVLANSFVFLFFQQFYFEFFRLDEGDNPPVYAYKEGGKINKIYPSFSDYVLNHIIEKYCQPVNNLWAKTVEDLHNFDGQDKHIQHLRLNGNVAFTTIPSKVFDFTNLISLDLQDSGVRFVPQEINKLTKLKTLNLSFNKITSIPKELFELKHLETLNLENNRLVKLSSNIQHLDKLKQLNLDKNNFSQHQLEKLEEIVSSAYLTTKDQRQLTTYQKILRFLKTIRNK